MATEVTLLGDLTTDVNMAAKAKFSLKPAYRNELHVKSTFSSSPMSLFKESMRSYHHMDFLTKVWKGRFKSSGSGRLERPGVVACQAALLC